MLPRVSLLLAIALGLTLPVSAERRTTGVPGNPMKLASRTGQPLLQRGDKLVRVPTAGLDPAGTTAGAPLEVTWKENVPQIELRIAPESLNLYRISR